MKLALRIAWRFLKSSPAQTALIVLGIGVGISVQVFIGSLIAGLQQDLIDTAVGSSSHVTVLPEKRGDTIPDYEALADRISDSLTGLEVVSPVADAAGFLRADAQGDAFPITLRGLNFQSAEKIYGFKSALMSGSLPGGENEVAIGLQLSQEAGISAGDTIEVLTPQGVPTVVTVTGIFDLGNALLNQRWALATLPTVQTIFGFGVEATAIEIQLEDVFVADSTAAELSELLPAGLKATNWKDENEALLSGLRGQSISSTMIQVFVIISVLLGIASVLAVSVIQKSKQIGILKAMGIKDRDASLVFLFQGLLLGILGSLAGILLGIGLSWAFSTFALNADGTPVVNLLLDPAFITVSGLLGVAASVLAALLPGIRSLKLNPIEVIRNG